MPTDPTDLTSWIAGLRNRLERGNLASLDPFDLGDGTGVLSGERTIRILLADLDDTEHRLRATPMSTMASCHRQRLLEDFRRLRELIG